MKRIIAIVAGGDTSEYQVSLRSAQGLYSFIDKEKYDLYIVVMHGLDWYVLLDDDKRVKEDKVRFRIYHHSWYSWRRWSVAGLF